MDLVLNHPQDPSMETAIANICSGVIDAIASQIDGLSKKVSKQIVRPKKDDPEKVKHLYKKIDATSLLCPLVDDVNNYLDAISTNEDSTISTLNPAIDALKFVSSEGKQQMDKMRSCMNNTK